MLFAFKEIRCNMEYRMGLKCECSDSLKGFGKILMGSALKTSLNHEQCNFMSVTQHIFQVC